MARTREFDTQETLRAAMLCFWSRGYEAASVTELLNAMHLQKGSLYQAFGSKHELFVDSIRIYISDMFEAASTFIAAQSSPTQAIRAWVDQKVEICKSDSSGQGCLIMNSLMELAHEDDEVRAIILEAVDRMLGLLRVVVKQGQDSKEFRTDVSPENLVGLIAIHTFGLYVVARGRIDALKQLTLTDLLLENLKP